MVVLGALDGSLGRQSRLPKPRCRACSSSSSSRPSASAARHAGTGETDLVDHAGVDGRDVPRPRHGSGPVDDEAAIAEPAGPLGGRRGEADAAAGRGQLGDQDGFLFDVDLPFGVGHAGEDQQPHDGAEGGGPEEDRIGSVDADGAAWNAEEAAEVGVRGAALHAAVGGPGSVIGLPLPSRLVAPDPPGLCDHMPSRPRRYQWKSWPGAITNAAT